MIKTDYWWRLVQSTPKLHNELGFQESAWVWICRCTLRWSIRLRRVSQRRRIDWTPWTALKQRSWMMQLKCLLPFSVLSCCFGVVNRISCDCPDGAAPIDATRIKRTKFNKMRQCSIEQVNIIIIGWMMELN